MTEQQFHIGQRVVAKLRADEFVHGTITQAFDGYTSRNYFVAYDTNNENHGRWFSGTDLESEIGNPA